jgi:hypothetical protein
MQDSGPDAVVAWNTRTGERRQVQRDAIVDPYDTVHDRDVHTLIGAIHGGEGADPPLRRDHRHRAHPSRAGRVSRRRGDDTSYTRDGHLALVQV